MHLPFSDEPLVDAVLMAAEDIQADRIVIAGDLLDFYNVNMHGPKHPDIATTLEDEIFAGQDFLIKLRKRFPDAEIVYLAGNHSFRLDRFILKNSKVFWNLLRLENMLDLEKLKIEYHEYNHCYQLENTNLYIQHSPPSYSVNGARVSLMKKMDANFIYGCTHRKDSAFITGFSGSVYSVYFNGWLGDAYSTKEHKQVFSYAKGHQNWQQGFSIVTVVDGKEHYVHQPDIRNRSFIVGENYYEA